MTYGKPCMRALDVRALDVRERKRGKARTPKACERFRVPGLTTGNARSPTRHAARRLPRLRATGSDATGSDATGYDATGSDATGSDTTGSDATGSA